MKTNLELVTEIMEFSNYGALAQAFVIDALYKHSKRVAESKPEDYPANMLINPETWINVAKEILGKLENRK